MFSSANMGYFTVEGGAPVPAALLAVSTTAWGGGGGGGGSLSGVRLSRRGYGGSGWVGGLRGGLVAAKYGGGTESVLCSHQQGRNAWGTRGAAQVSRAGKAPGAGAACPPFGRPQVAALPAHTRLLMLAVTTNSLSMAAELMGTCCPFLPEAGGLVPCTWVVG